MFDLQIIKNFYKDLNSKVINIKEKLNKPLTLSEKILYAHSSNDMKEFKRGVDYVDFKIDRVAMQDATAQMALLQFIVANKSKVAVPTTVHADHLIQAKINANERILDSLFPKGDQSALSEDAIQRQERTREKMRRKLNKGEYESKIIKVNIHTSPMPLMQVMGPIGMDDMTGNIQDMLSNIMPKKNKTQRLKVEDAREVFIKEESEKLIDMDDAIKVALKRAEQNGIVFLDEIDKIAGSDSSGPDVSREGVQRDILPIVEGCTVSTKYGQVKTDHVLFIAAGAFHVSRPSDLIPELQGRFPIRVEMNNLTKSDFIKILTQPKNALIVQYMALLEAEGVELKFRSKNRSACRLFFVDVQNSFHGLVRKSEEPLAVRFVGHGIHFVDGAAAGHHQAAGRNYNKKK